MRERRFLVHELPDSGEIEIAGPEAHHLLHVLRLRPGDEIVVFDGLGKQFRAVLTRCERAAAWAGSLTPLPSRESPLELSLAVALPKADKMAIVVQKTTELGVRRLFPLFTSRTVVRPSDTHKQLARWRRTAEEACKQSGRAFVPIIAEPLPFDELLELDLPSTRLLLTGGGSNLTDKPEPLSCLAAVGPEGGWTEQEIAAALNRGFRPFALGPRTLRTETAAVTAAALLQWLWGDGNRE
jgi:16S rRNA (uracil1498-N3)-methyltransferase